jgi:Anti-sigma-K factor rskA
MLSESDIEAAHPEAFDFVFGNLPQAKRSDFDRHRTGCRYCQAVIDEYAEIGQIIKSLPPHVEPPADLEDRTITAMAQALAEQRAQTDRQAESTDQAATRILPIPRHTQPEAEARVRPPLAYTPASADSAPQVSATRLPLWRRHPRWVAGLAVAAAVIIAVAVVIPRLGASPSGPVVTSPLHATAAAKVIGDGAASGQGVARPSGPSWTFVLSVRGLKVLPDNDVYECWWTKPGSTKAHPGLVSGGTFIVDSSGATTVTMTNGVDPRQFRIMEITVESPGNGAQLGPVILTGQST